MTVSRTERLAEQIRQDASDLLARKVHDPGVGFITLTRVRVTPDLQIARIYYTSLDDDAAARASTARALKRVTPFLRRQLGHRLQLRRVPELEFVFDRSIAHQARVEQLLQEIHAQDEPVSDDARDHGSDDKHK
jgi:ribosome-binding factor A